MVKDTNTSDQTSVNATSALIDRGCIMLDGNCDCPRPVLDHCKYLKKEDFEDDTHIDTGHQTVSKEP